VQECDKLLLTMRGDNESPFVFSPSHESNPQCMSTERIGRHSKNGAINKFGAATRTRVILAHTEDDLNTITCLTCSEIAGCANSVSFVALCVAVKTIGYCLLWPRLTIPGGEKVIRTWTIACGKYCGWFTWDLPTRSRDIQKVLIHSYAR